MNHCSGQTVSQHFCFKRQFDQRKTNKSPAWSASGALVKYQSLKMNPQPTQAAEQKAKNKTKKQLDRFLKSLGHKHPETLRWWSQWSAPPVVSWDGYLRWCSAATHPGHTSLWRPSPDSERSGERQPTSLDGSPRPSQAAASSKRSRPAVSEQCSLPGAQRAQSTLGLSHNACHNEIWLEIWTLGLIVSSEQHVTPALKAV